MGPLSIQGVFVPQAAAELGASFAFATPSEVQARAAALTAATVPRKVDRGQTHVAASAS
jgi:hypothetical protein